MAEEKKNQTPSNYQLTIISKDLPLVENYCRQLSNASKADGITMSGVTRFPVKRLCITTRKSPCGNGSNTWDRFEMRMYKRSFGIATTQDQLQALFKKVKNPAGVQITLTENQ